MANVTIRTCDRCGKGVNADAGRVALCSDRPGMIDDRAAPASADTGAINLVVALSLDLCTRCTDSLRKWATEISRRAAAKEGASQ